MKTDKKTIVINLFGGPGAGKTTMAHELVAELKKANVEVEFVGEYAKELIYSNKLEMLDGSVENEVKIANEKKRRIDMYNGKVDVIVTDAPILASAIYFKEKHGDSEESQVFTETLKKYSDEYNNLNFQVQRGDYYEERGRVHTREESLVLDDINRTFLNEHYPNYDVLNQSDTQKVVDAITQNIGHIREVEVEHDIPGKSRIQDLNPSQQKLVSFILDELSEDKIPWKKPWDKKLNNQPRNATTGTRYSGNNQLMLTLTSFSRGFIDPRWCTFNQAKENNWKIKKGAKSVQLVYPLLYSKKLKKYLIADDFKGLTPAEVKELKSGSVLKLKYFNVFNAEEIVGIPKLKERELMGPPFINKVAETASQNILQTMNIDVMHMGEHAFYKPGTNMIVMPPKETFESEEAYYGTLFHELSHATSSEEHLNREIDTEFGSERYSEEELVAEFSSIFLSQDLGYSGFNGTTIENKGAYINHWAQKIKDDPAVIQRAINNANNAYHYLYDAGNVKELIEEVEAQFTKMKDADGKVPLDVLKRDVLITEYAEAVLGLKLNPLGRGIISTMEHDSLMIYTDKNDFYRFSTAKGGTIIDFIMHMEDVDFNTAVNKARDYYYQYEPGAQEYTPRQSIKSNNLKNMELPEPAEDNKKVISYLTKTRGLPVGIVNDFINKGLLYQDKLDNCVFVGKLEDTALFATRRAAKKSSFFRADVASSIGEVGIFYKNGGNNLILTEGIIDAMSLMTLKANDKNYDYLSVNGVGKAKQVLNFHMVKRPEAENYDRVIIAFDNDTAGEEATNDLIEFINEKYPDLDVFHAYPPNAKDWNDELMNMSKKHEGVDLENSIPKANAMGMSL